MAAEFLGLPHGPGLQQQQMKPNFGATILTISGKKAGDQGNEDLLVDSVFLGWERAVSMMDQVTSVAKKWLGKHGYKGPLSALEFFAQKNTKLLEAQHGVRKLEQAGGVKGGVWIYNSCWLATGHGKVEGTVLSACPRCIFSQQRTLQQHLGLLHTSRLRIAPAFTWPSVNIASPFMVKCPCGSNYCAKARVSTQDALRDDDGSVPRQNLLNSSASDFVYHFCNTVNGIPFALHKAGPGNLDPAIICPNRLLLGHANKHVLVAPVRAGNLNEHMQLVSEVDMAFHQTWTQERIQLFVHGRPGRRRSVFRPSWATSSSLPNSQSR